MIKGIIFDLDDTLYDARSCYQAGQNELAQFSANRFGLSTEEFNVLFSEANKAVKRQLGNVASSHNRLLYIQHFLENIRENPACLALEMYEIYWRTVLKNMKLFPYVLPLFQLLKDSGLRIAILSDLTAQIQHRKIKALGIEKFVDVLVTSEEVGEEKPSRKMFDCVIAKLNLKPEELLMIGDSLERDIAGAKAIGIKAILYQKDMDIIGEVRKCCQ